MTEEGTAIMEQNPLRNIEIKREESAPHTFEEYIADFKRDLPTLRRYGVNYGMRKSLMA